tara:strand:+ start:324 stop:1046 length:723 start_codon:yes stop_codon:yes gene_type:complete
MLALKLGNSLSGLGKTGENIYSLAFNGTDEYVSIDGFTSEISTATGTISAWVKINTTSSTGKIWECRVSSSTDNLFNLLYHAGTNQVRFTYKAGGTLRTAIFSDAIEGDGKWHNIVGTWDTVADEIKVYLDGTLKDTTTGLGTWAGTPTISDIGQSTQNGNYFNGNIAQIAIFDKVVTPIADLYVDRVQPVDLIGMVNLIGYWKFDEGSGTTALDSTSFGNNGTLYNTPTWSTDVPYKAN